MDNIKDQFLLNINGLSSTRSSLTQLGIKGNKIDSLIKTWTLDKYKYQALPSKSDLDAFVIKGIIDQGTWRLIMSRHGFSALHMDWYWKEIEDMIGRPKRMPTKSEANAWLKKKTIDQVQWTLYYKQMGYGPEEINNYQNSL